MSLADASVVLVPLRYEALVDVVRQDLFNLNHPAGFCRVHEEISVPLGGELLTHNVH